MIKERDNYDAMIDNHLKSMQNDIFFKIAKDYRDDSIIFFPLNTKHGNSSVGALFVNGTIHLIYAEEIGPAKLQKVRISNNVCAEIRIYYPCGCKSCINPATMNLILKEISEIRFINRKGEEGSLMNYVHAIAYEKCNHQYYEIKEIMGEMIGLEPVSQ